MSTPDASRIDAEVQRSLSVIHPAWLHPTGPLDTEELAAITRRAIAEPGEIHPAPHQIFRALAADPTTIKVVILGQDPYPTPGNAVGLSFSAPAHASVPRSLVNIYRELHDDLGVEIPNHPDLSVWSGQGVLLLNRVLTVRSGEAGSHRNRGWEAITESILRYLADITPCVAILWGRDARQMAGVFGSDRCIESPHPSPMSARRGFFGSRPFSRANELLAARGIDPVDWTVPAR